MKGKLAILLSVIAVLVVATILTRSEVGLEVCSGPGKRITNLRSVAIASAQYFYANGSMPKSFSQLYPDYIDSSGIFFADHSAPPSPNQSPDLIDFLTHYRVTRVSDRSWIFYEQPGIYADGSMTWVKFRASASEELNKIETSSGTCSRSEVAPFFREVLNLEAM